jgi:hypothetical protein
MTNMKMIIMMRIKNNKMHFVYLNKKSYDSKRINKGSIRYGSRY